jgi:hypothetical protein
MLAATIALLCLWGDTRDQRKRWELGRARLPSDMNIVSYIEFAAAAVFELRCLFGASREISTGSDPEHGHTDIDEESSTQNPYGSYHFARPCRV